MKILPKTILLATLIVAPLASMAAERLLAQGTEYQVTHNTAGACGKSAAITIRSEDFEFFTRNSSQLQNILDGARAMIEFQCGRIAAIAVVGELRGLHDPVYSGKAQRDNDWILMANRSIREARKLDYRPGPAPVDTSSGQQGYTVANLKTGMSVRESENAIRKAFDATPHYDPELRLMTLHLNGCPDDYSWNRPDSKPVSGWKCLKVWFSDQRVPELERLELVQVIDGTDMNVAESSLDTHFGQPDDRQVEINDNRWQRSGKMVRMSWGEHTDDDSGHRELEANLTRLDGRIVTVIELNEAGLAADWAAKNELMTGLVL